MWQHVVRMGEMRNIHEILVTTLQICVYSAAHYFSWTIFFRKMFQKYAECNVSNLSFQKRPRWLPFRWASRSLLWSTWNTPGAVYSYSLEWQCVGYFGLTNTCDVGPVIMSSLHTPKIQHQCEGSYFSDSVYLLSIHRSTVIYRIEKYICCCEKLVHLRDKCFLL